MNYNVWNVDKDIFVDSERFCPVDDVGITVFQAELSKESSTNFNADVNHIKACIYKEIEATQRRKEVKSALCAAS